MQEVLDAGYIHGNHWEQMLRQHMERYLPDLTAELRKTDDFEAYLVVRVDGAQEQYSLMIEQGMSPDDSRQQALLDLMPTPPDEVNQTPAWETMGAIDGSLAGQIRYLQSLQWQKDTSSKPSQRTP